MEKSKVFFTNLRAKPGNNLLNKLKNLCIKAGIKNINFSNKLCAIKIHFGEPGNIAYIRPNYAREIVHLIKELGGKPFLTDSNTLYAGRRANAVEHLKSAYENGFNPLATDANIIIVDGLRGNDYKEIEINLELCKTAKIGKAIAESDIIINMSHFKGHEMTGFGGALKNLGMGCASVSGKLELHSTSKPIIRRENCTSCNLCVKNCSQNAIYLDNERKAVIDYDKCIGCGQCVAMCQFDSAQVVWEAASELVSKKIAEYSYAVVKDIPSFHINFIMNVSPDCDCFPSNDYPIVPDIGITASFDPVALDMACVDLVKKAPAMPGSKINQEHIHNHLENKDKFTHTHPNTNWEAGLKYAEKIKLGTMNYELIEV